MRPRRAWSTSASQVSGPAPITTKVTLCASCHAELPFKATRCPSCGAPRDEPKDPLATTVPAASVASAVGTAAGFRFGIGFALGALAIAALVWLGVSALQGGNGSIAFGSPTASVFNGSGSTTSEPVRLVGVVDVEWSARPSSTAACRIRAVLRIAARPSDHEVLAEQVSITEATGTHVLYGLVDNDYVIEVDSTCDWTFRLKPRS